MQKNFNEFEEKLFSKYEFYRPELPQTQSLICFGLEVGKGWYPLIEELSEKLNELYLKEKEKVEINKQAKALLQDEEVFYFNVFQVKEKFGTLRFYVDGGTDEMHKLINEYEVKTEITCEMCGAPGERTTTNGWVKTLCNTCKDEE